MNMLTSGIEVMDGRDLLTDLTSIPTKAGVYSWYRRLSVDELTTVAFNTSIESRMHANTVLPTFVGSSGPYAVVLQPDKTALTPAKMAIANAVGTTLEQRSRFAHALLIASVFQAPMYVGKADDLRVRIKNHRDGITGFAKRIAPHNLMPNELVVAFVAFDNLPPKTNELLEYVLTILATPPFVKRRG
jgi:hypothetical protein